jgi:iron complex outermembrane receptor protein
MSTPFQSAVRHAGSVRRHLSIAVYGLGIVVAATPAWAQVTSTTDTSPVAIQRLETITVTAQRREQNLQDVPVAVEAFSTADIANDVLTDVTNLGMVAPGLVSDAQFGWFEPHLRGVGTTVPSPTLENPVAVYVDGVYYASQFGSVFQLASIDSVEVDKGPQGTLFGRNATGGLIQIRTKEPQQDFEANASVTAADYQTFGTKDYINGGLSPGVAANLSVYWQNQAEGFGRNEYNGDFVNRAQNVAIRQRTSFTPSDSDKIMLSLDYEQDHTIPVFIPAPGTTPLAGPPYTGPRQGADGYVQPFSRERQGGVSLQVDHDFGFSRLESLSAYERSHYDGNFDGSLIVDPAYLLYFEGPSVADQYSQEFSLRSEGDARNNWSTGLYLIHLSGKYDPFITLGELIAPLSSIDNYSDVNTNSAAAYAQLTHAIDDTTNLTVGARYTFEHKRWTASELGFYPGLPPVSFGAVTGDTLQYEKPTWRLSLDHKLTADNMVYASYNRGFKSGGFNETTLTAPPFAPETLDAFEIGSKNDWAGHRIQVNGSAFYYNYTNIQVVSYQSGSEIIYNGAKSHIYGTDLDFRVIPIENLTLSGGLEFLHATFSSFPSAQFSTPMVGGGTAFSTSDATGRRLPLAPSWSIDVSPTYSISLGDRGDLLLSSTVSYTSGVVYEPDNRLYQPAHTLVNASAAWISPAKTYTARLWIKNLSNVQYTVAEYSQSVGDYALYAPPQTFGITLSRKF